MGSKPKKMSASRVSKLLGFNKFDGGSVLDLWYELMEEEYPGWLRDNGYNWTKKDISDKPEIRCGLIFEMAILNHTAEKLNLVPGCFEKEYTSGVLSCHCDCHLFATGRAEEINAEAKTSTVFSFRDNWGEPGTDQIPDYYYSQVQLQMGLSGIKRTVVPLLVFPNRQVEILPYVHNLDYCYIYDIVKAMDTVGLLKLYYVDFDQEIFDKMEAVAKSFWEKYILGMTPPLTAQLPVDQKFFLPVNGKIQDPELLKKSQKIRDIDDEIKKYEAELKIKKHALLKDVIGKAPESKTGKVQLLNEKGRVGATFNSITSRFSVRRIKEKKDV